MKVLIADFDLFSAMGGGQTFYRTLIEDNPEIEFAFLSTPGSPSISLPKNAKAVHFRRFYSSRTLSKYSQTSRVLDRVAEALNIAASVQGMSFDVVDFPDYYQYGAFLPPALEFHGVKVGSVAVSMHGVISTSLLRNWDGEKYSRADLQTAKMLERLQYEGSDVRYAISERYADEWKAECGIRASIYDPMRVMQSFAKVPRAHPPVNVSPRLVFIGRTEKRKGPDLAIELVSMLPKGIRTPLHIVGPDSHTPDGLSSAAFLRRHAVNRNVEAVFLGKKEPNELHDMLKDPSIVLLPSRYDTFNLVALEALFQGCPAAIGDGAGVCDFLDKRFPALPYTRLDTRNPFKSAEVLTDAVVRFAEHREKLTRALEGCDFSPKGPRIAEIYREGSRVVRSVRELAESQFLDSIRLLGIDAPKRRASFVKARIQATKKALTRVSLLKRVRSLLIAYRQDMLGSRIKAAVIRWVSKNGHYDRVVEAYYFFRAFNLRKILQSVSTTGRINKVTGELEREKEIGRALAAQRFSRAKVFIAAAYGEERIGSFAVAAAYGIRVLRWTPKFPKRLVADVKRWLVLSGFIEESQVASLMFHEPRPEAIESYLEKRRQDLRTLEVPNFEILESNTPAGSCPRVSIIVSMYNAANKLERFLELISNQTLLRANGAELILVDSGSRRSEIEVIQSLIRKYEFPWTYARTYDRETIQQAWNRGIYLSKAPNVCFLGVDETLIPESLEILQSVLDRNPDVDWAMADSIVTEVTSSGEWLRDIMTYNRSGFRLSKHILECCYLSYVGGLYRKSIHERVGYYDPTFKAAGDTEFKNRALPHIRAVHVPQSLGIFLNYPEERTTQHPRAEIEDLRAWYLFRTEGGLRYLTSRMSNEEVMELFKDCLSYRKSYCGHTSYDLEVASALVPIVKSRIGGFGNESIVWDIERCRAAIQNLEWDRKSLLGLFSGLIRVKYWLARLRSDCARFIEPRSLGGFGLFHENRFEQHSNVW